MNTKEITARLDNLTTHSPDCAAITNPYAPDDAHDLNSAMLRHIISYLPDDIDDADNYDDAPDFAELLELIHALAANEYAIDIISRYALDYSLCPMHFCDYCSCFDDDDPECAQIRAIFPSHDT